MKYFYNRITKLIGFILLLLCLLVTPALAVKSYDASAALAYAKANWNRNPEQWCAEFVKNCLKAGGCTKIDANSCTIMVGQLKDSDYGSWHKLEFERDGRISVSKNKNILSPGDPVFYYCPYETDGRPYVHVVLYSGQDNNGYLKAYAHNSPKNNETMWYRTCGYCKNPVSGAYVYHMNSTASSSKPQYFDCNVQITCITGKTVNLYNNPGDSSRVSYFSKGQSMKCSYGAKLSDGSTWYRVTVNSSGAVKDLWLKYESSKMTVTNMGDTIQTYTIKYDSNGGSGAPSAQKKSKGKALTLSNVRPTRSGYTFEGWSTSRNGSVQYKAGSQYTANKSVTLYAVWSKNSSKPQYFDCNIQISCINGKIVNLYNNPGDSEPVTYFSKGQSMTSRYGAKLNDNSTWYRVTVNSSGTIKDVWMKYESEKMTIKDLSSSLSQSAPVTLKFERTSISLDLSENVREQVALTISGGLSSGSVLHYSLSDDIVDIDWSEYKGKLILMPIFTAKMPGTTTLTCSVSDKDNNILDTASMKITVIASSKPEYFDCNVEIKCVNGQVVNLYRTPGDSTRVTYFSKGQTANSTQGAKMSDGSTWYQILAQDSSGKVGTYWLKYESNKMTVSNIKNTYTVKYDANGGSGAPSAQTKTEGETLILSNSKPSRSEYAFAGWSTSRNGKAEYQPGGQYTFDKNITLYAVWTPQNKAVITLEESTFVVEEYEYFTVNFSYSGDADHVAYNIANGDICRQISTSTWPEQNGMTKMSMDFRASSPGTTTISFELLDKNGNPLDSTTASVTVKERTGDPIPLGSYEYFLGNPEMKVGESLAIWVKVKYSDGTQKDVTRECLLSSSDDDILSVQGDTIIAQKAGTAQLLLTFPEGVTTSKTITVTEDAEVQENLWISFDQPEYTCYVDDEYPVHFRLNYSTNATDATYRWSIADLSLIYMAHSSDYTSSASPEISLRYDKLGDTTLTVTITQDGQTASASCVIHVRERYDRKNTIYIDLENWRDFYGVYPHLKVSYLYPPMQYSVSIISVKTGETVWEADASQSLGMNGGKGQFTEDWDISSLPAGTYRAIATSKNSYGTVTTETYDFTL